MSHYGFTTQRDAAVTMAEAMGLEPDDVYEALGELRQEFGRWEDLHGEEYERVCGLVRAHVADAEQIVVGNWVVAGTSADETVIGEILELDGDNASVGWSSGVRTTLDMTREDVAVYDSRDVAIAVYETRVKGMQL